MSLAAYTPKTWVDYADTPCLEALELNRIDTGIGAVTAELIALEAALPTTYQPISSELSALAGLSSTGYAKRTGAGAWSVVASIPQGDVSGLTAALAGKQAGSSVLTSIAAQSSGSGFLRLAAGVASLDATAYQPLDSDLTAIAALTTTVFGRSLLTAADAAAARTAIGAQAAGSYQPLDADLTAVSALATTGFVRRTAADTWAASVLVWGDIASGHPIVTAGTGLTGGGSLTGSVTLAVSYGTTAGTAAQGNDSRILNGQTAFGWGNHASAGYALSSAIPLASTTTPAALGTAAVGTGTTWARADHVHAMPTAAQVSAEPALGSSAAGYLLSSNGTARSWVAPYVHPVTHPQSVVDAFSGWISDALNGRVLANAWNNQAIALAGSAGAYFSDSVVGDICVRAASSVPAVRLGVYPGSGNPPSALWYSQTAIGFAWRPTWGGLTPWDSGNLAFGTGTSNMARGDHLHSGVYQPAGSYATLTGAYFAADAWTRSINPGVIGSVEDGGSAFSGEPNTSWNQPYITFGSGANRVTQIAGAYDQDVLSFRRRGDSAWSGWSHIWHSGNLTGIRNEHNHAGVYLPVSGGTMSGNIDLGGFSITSGSTGLGNGMVSSIAGNFNNLKVGTLQQQDGSSKIGVASKMAPSSDLGASLGGLADRWLYLYALEAILTTLDASSSIGAPTVRFKAPAVIGSGTTLPAVINPGDVVAVVGESIGPVYNKPVTNALQAVSYRKADGTFATAAAGGNAIDLDLYGKAGFVLGISSSRAQLIV